MDKSMGRMESSIEGKSEGAIGFIELRDFFSSRMHGNNTETDNHYDIHYEFTHFDFLSFWSVYYC